MEARNKSVCGYDRLASVYRPLETCLFGNSLQRARVSLLSALPKINSAIVLGDGDGRLLEQLCKTQPECRVTSVDQSSEMLKHQRRRVHRRKSDDRVNFLQLDAKDFCPPEGGCDLLVAAYFLDCFRADDLAVLLPQWLRGLRAGGLFYFVDFIQPSSGWRRHQSRVYQTLMHWFFRWQTGLPNRQLVDLDEILAAQDLELIANDPDVHPMIACRCYRTRGRFTH